jgi:hypothetical protein
MRATQLGGALTPLGDQSAGFYIMIPGTDVQASYYGGAYYYPDGIHFTGDPYYIIPTQLPDISDSKTVDYHSENIPGRSSPMKIFHASNDRTIQITLHCTVVMQSDILKYLTWKRALESCLYPTNAEDGMAPFGPPKVCKIQCGLFLAQATSGKNSQPAPVCAILKSCSTKAGTDVAWDEATYLPWKFSIDTSWDVVYASTQLPVDNRLRYLGS